MPPGPPVPLAPATQRRPSAERPAPPAERSPSGEQGAPAAPGTQAAGRWLAHAPYAVVLAGVTAALVTIRLGGQYVKSGTLVLAGVLLLAAVARLVLPDRRVGLLSSRRRLLDAVILAALGLGLLATGWLVPVPA